MHLILSHLELIPKSAFFSKTGSLENCTCGDVGRAHKRKQKQVLEPDQSVYARTRFLKKTKGQRNTIRGSCAVPPRCCSMPIWLLNFKDGDYTVWLIPVHVLGTGTVAGERLGRLEWNTISSNGYYNSDTVRRFGAVKEREEMFIMMCIRLEQTYIHDSNLSFPLSLACRWSVILHIITGVI